MAIWPAASEYSPKPYRLSSVLRRRAPITRRQYRTPDAYNLQRAFFLTHFCQGPASVASPDNQERLPSLGAVQSSSTAMQKLRSGHTVHFTGQPTRYGPQGATSMPSPGR
jgi:hypothetical protein